MGFLAFYFVLFAERNCKLVKVVENSGNKITCVTSLSGLVYAVRRNAQQQFDVYDAATVALRRPISVPGLTKSFGIASSVTHSCLYASAFNNDKVYRVKLSGEITSWSVGRFPMGVSVNGANNVLVASNHQHILEEYTPNGAPLRQIELPFCHPQNAIQLRSGHFAVTCYDQVCLVDKNGTFISGAKAKPVIKQLQSYPRGLQQLKSGRILVADTTGNRILVLNESMHRVGDLTLPISFGLIGPWSVCLDESCHRLYISENPGGRLLVFDNIKSV